MRPDTAMTVRDVFYFGDGRSVLVVTVPGEPSSTLLPRGAYDLFEDGRLIHTVDVENEMMTTGRRRAVGRSLGLSHRVDLPSGPPARALTLAPRRA